MTGLPPTAASSNDVGRLSLSAGGRLNRGDNGRCVIFVFGLPRSGTTWLAKIFDSHPDVLYRHEPDISVRGSELPRYCALDEVEPHLARTREYLERLAEVRSLKAAGPLPVFAKDHRSTPARLLRAAL